MKIEEKSVSPSSSGDPLRGLARVVVSQPENREAARALLRAVSPSLLRAVRGVLGAHHPDVPDVCQESAVALLAALRDFRGHCSLTHFACRIAVFTAMNSRRRARFSGRSVTTDEAEPTDGAPGPAEDADAARRRAALRRLLDELPPAQAEVLALHVMLGHTVQETAATLGAPLDTVRSRLRRALAQSPPALAPPADNEASATPPSAQALFAKANRARSSQRAQEAIRLYRLLHRSYPTSAEALTSRVALGRLLLAEGEHAGALAEFDRQVAAGGALAEEALVWRARTRQKLGDFAGEQRDFRLLLERYPNTAYEQEARSRLGQ